MRIIFILLLLANSSAHAQSIIHSLLEAPVSDFEYEEIAASKAFLNDNNFNSPWLRDVDFRVRTRNDASIEEYRMRFGLINPLEIVANKRYQKILNETLVLRQEVRLKQILEQRMGLIVERVRLEMRMTHTDSAIVFLHKIRGIVLEEANDKVIEDLINIEDDLFNLKIEKQNLLHRYEVNSFLIAERIGSSISTKIDSTELVSVEGMAADIFSFEQSNSQLQLFDQELRLEESLYSIDKAEAWSNIGFVQAEYDIDRGSNFNDHLGYQIGVTLPLFNSKKPDLKREKLELIEEQTQQKAKKSALKESFNSQEMRFTHELESWYMAKEYEQRLTEIESLGLTSVKSVITLRNKKGALKEWQINALANLWLGYIQLKLVNTQQALFLNFLTKEQQQINIQVE
ncbi:MAG: hypothetical protein ACI9A7_000580 [Cyclobacteriaceae bacterium]|jgi:hypothetical protein